MPFAGFGDAVTVRPSPLPVELGPGPFSTAGARLLGVPPERLGRSDLVHPTRGAHMLVEPETLVERALAFQVAMPGDRAFSHVTAALLWGLPLPRALEQLATAEGAPLHVMAPTGATSASCRVARSPSRTSSSWAMPSWRDSMPGLGGQPAWLPCARRCTRGTGRVARSRCGTP